MNKTQEIQKKYLGKKVKTKRQFKSHNPGFEGVIIGYYNCNKSQDIDLLFYSKDFEGHDGEEYGMIYLKGYENVEKRGLHCWFVGLDEIEIIEDFKHIFNKLSDKHGK